MNSSYFSEGGGVLVWILIAVALFAALSYTMVREGGTGAATRTMSDAQARLAAAEIIAYGDAVKQAIQKMRISGAGDTEPDFQTPVFINSAGNSMNKPNPHCTAASCRVFDPSGGGVQAAAVSANAVIELEVAEPTPQAGHWAAHQFKVEGVGTEELELLFSAHEIRKEVCMKINDLLGVQNPSGAPPVDNVSGIGWNGQYVSSAILGDEEPALHGKRAMCFQRITSGVPWFQYSVVLIAR
ncbi:MAG: hypothetical protein WC989_06115 [Micavibrio sp.]